MVWFASICTLLPFQVFSLEGSVVQFEATHFGIMTVHGTLDEIKGQVTQATSDRWLFEGEIAVRSINTGNSSRDETLLLEQYLDHENIPYHRLLRKYPRQKRYPVDSYKCLAERPSTNSRIDDKRRRPYTFDPTHFNFSESHWPQFWRDGWFNW